MNETAHNATRNGDSTMINAMQAAYNFVTSNPTLCDYLATEARKQVAADIRAKTNSGTTEKAVELLLANGRDKTIEERFAKYLAAGTAAFVAMRMQSVAA